MARPVQAILRSGLVRLRQRIRSSAIPASKSQFNGFVETARKLDCDEDKERFEQSLGKIARYKPAKDGSATNTKEAKRDRQKNGYKD
jgi:hypothetical protein